jgi:PKD repeat protein
MKKKIVGIFVIMLMISGAMTSILFSDNSKVEASGGGQQGGTSVDLPYDWVWNYTQKFANVIHDVNWSENGENGIPKGRCWATAGENYTIAKILKPAMDGPNSTCGLTNYTNLSIGYISGIHGLEPGTNDPKQYSSKIVIHDYSLTIYNKSVLYRHLPYNETFPLGVGTAPPSKDIDTYLNQKWNFTNATIRKRILATDDFLQDHYNVSCDLLNTYGYIIGPVVYLDAADSIPENHNCVFILNEEPTSEGKFENLSDAMGCILIENESKEYNFQNSEQYNYAIANVSGIDNNFSIVLSEIKNGSVYAVSNIQNNENLIFSNYSNASCCGSSDIVNIVQLNNEGSYSSLPLLTYLWAMNNHSKGVIMSSHQVNESTHVMSYAVRDWNWFHKDQILGISLYSDRYALPIFSVNNTIGQYIIDHISSVNVTGFLDQEYRQQNNTTHPEVISHNVVAYRNTTQSPNNAIVVLSNRIDGFAGETPGDSGVAGAILLGIAKYFKDNNITPKYNLTFLFTTGEEYGMRGAQHYIDSHPKYNGTGNQTGKYNFIHWIGFDQLGFNHTFSNEKHCLVLRTNNITAGTEDILNVIGQQTDYEKRVKDNYTFDTNDSASTGAEDYVWNQNGVNTILFEKGNKWDGHHQVGENFQKGDSLANIDRNDVNVTFELAWNVTKYFTVNPNCWFNNSPTHEMWDSNQDSISDSVNVSFSVKSILPYDRIWVKATLVSQKYPRTCRFTTDQNYIITPLGIEGTLTITLPREAPEDLYYLKVYLYNSTGEIDRKCHPLISDYTLGSTYSNASYQQGPYQMYPANLPPLTPEQPSGDDDVLVGIPHFYTTSTTDPEEDPIWYQWKYETILGEYQTLWANGGPHASGEEDTKIISWLFPGTYNVSTRAKYLLNPNVMSNWSDALPVTVSPWLGDPVEWNKYLIDSLSQSVLAVGQQTSSNGFAQGIYVEQTLKESLNWTWDYGDGNFSYGEAAAHDYNQVGNYTVILRIRNSEGYYYNCSENVTVLILNANFIMGGDAQTGKTTLFNDTSMGDNQIENWTWDFGDGNISYERNTSHAYAANGVYNVTLAVMDTENNTHTVTRQAIVETSPPKFIYEAAEPDIVGLGFPMAISADFYEDFVENQSGIRDIWVNITYPDNMTQVFPMDLNASSEHDYTFTFNDTWQSGIYSYIIWTIDNSNNCNSSIEHYFHVSTDVTISIATLQDSYSSDQYINITDPPSPLENLTLVARGLTWNTFYNASSGYNILEAYQGPVNYQQDNGTWTPINTTISQLATNHPAYVYGYRKGNDQGLYGVYFKSNAQNDWPIAFTYNRSDDPTTHVVRSKLVGVGYVDPASDWAYQYLQNAQSSQGQTTGNTVTYEDVFTGTDVTWSYGNTGLKEEIILSNATRTVLQNHPPSMYGLNNGSSYLVFITKLDYQNLNLYNASGVLSGNITISDMGVDFKDALGQFKCTLPLGEAYELNNESMREKLTYRIVHLNGNTYLLSGLKISDLDAMTFPVVIDPTLTLYTSTSDGYLSSSDSDYSTVWAAKDGTVSDTDTDLWIGQKKVTSIPPEYQIYRGFLFFNTSSLPSNAIIDNATLTLYKEDDYSTTDFVITIQNGQPTYPHDPLETGDYDKDCYSGESGGLDTADFEDGLNEIVLTNLSWINQSSMTKLCLRSSLDINSTQPTGNEYVTVYSADITQEYQAYIPKLIIMYRNQSKIKNTGSTDIKGYLLIQIQYYNTSQSCWLVEDDTIRETSPRTIESGDQLALDTIFNGHVQASDLTHNESSYRVYAMFGDPEYKVLKTDDGVELVAWWQFSIT